MRVWSVDMRSDPSIELVHEPSDRTARRPLAVRPAVAGRDLDGHHSEAPLRLSGQRCRRNRIRPLDGANARAAGERQHEGPGQGAIGRKFVLKGGQLVHVAVHGRDEIDEALGCEGSALPADREHKAGHDDRGSAVRPAASDRCAGTTPLRWRRGAKGRIKAGAAHRMWPQRGPITAMSPKSRMSEIDRASPDPGLHSTGFASPLRWLLCALRRSAFAATPITY